MKLNYDCIRDVLLYIEENCGCPQDRNEFMRYTKILNAKELEKYTHDEKKYVLMQLISNNYIICDSKRLNIKDGILSSADISCLSWEGHTLLSSIRNDTVFNAVKNKAKKIGGASITAISSASKALITAMLVDPNALQNFINGTSNIINLLK